MRVISRRLHTYANTISPSFAWPRIHVTTERISRVREVFRQWKRRAISRNPARTGVTSVSGVWTSPENFLLSYSVCSRAYGDSEAHMYAALVSIETCRRLRAFILILTFASRKTFADATAERLTYFWHHQRRTVAVKSLEENFTSY